MSTMSMTTQILDQIALNVKDRVLDPKINAEALKKFKDKEKQDEVKALTDLRDLRSKSENEVYDILNAMVKNKQYFMYCGSLLLNINPGTDHTKDYLNLQTWVKETESIEEANWKPHLYSFMYYVYQTMRTEKKDQVVNMLGQIGSGKTFNIIHIIEYYCCMVGPEGHQIEVFDKIHKAVQLVHIMGSILRENNLESTSCGILLRLGFGKDYKICNFDIDAKILDCTLPFSENGRSFSVLHSLMSAASADLKRAFNLPEDEIHLNFFRKFGKTFSQKTKDRFRLNDLETWTRYHSLLSSFGFVKQEVIEILQIFAFILMINELGTAKVQGANKSMVYIITKGHCTKKLAKNLNMDEDELIKAFGSFKDPNEIKSTLISVIKYAYHIVFDYINRKIKENLKGFFSDINKSSGGSTANVLGGLSAKKRNSLSESINYINFLDFPGEVEDSTLGGLMTNLANECINLNAGSSYSSVVEKLLEERLNMKLFQPLHSYHVVKSLMGDKGFFNYLSMPFTEENFNQLVNSTYEENHFKKCINFVDNNKVGHDNQFKFKVNFTTKSVIYDYETLYMETKSITNTARVIRLFSGSNNSIINSTYQKIINPNGNIFQYAYDNIMSLFKPLENFSPYVVYCLHSNNSYKLFFDKKSQSQVFEPNWVIPKNLTISLMKKSLCIPVLYWEWFGYSEWLENETFIRDFSKDFERIEQSLSKGKDFAGKTIKYSDLSNNEKISYIINSLLRNCDFSQGTHHVVMKKGTIIRLRNRLNSFVTINASKKGDSKTTKSTIGSKQKAGSTLSTTGRDSAKKQSPVIESRPSKGQITIDRRNDMKTQCHLSILDSKSTYQNSNNTSIEASQSNIICNKYNVYRIFNRTANELDSCRDKDPDEEEFIRNSMEEYRKKNNIVIPDKSAFNLVQDLFDPTKNRNFKIFDYSRMLPEIVKIQSVFRVRKAKEKHLILRYIMSKVVKLQALARGICRKKKYLHFKKLLSMIVRLQRFFKPRHQKVLEGVTLIQSNYRQKLAQKRSDRKLKRKRECLANEEEYFDTSDEEGIRNNMRNKEKKASTKPVKKDLKKKDNRKPKNYIDVTKINDKNQLISTILKDHDLMKENEATNRKLANQKGIDKKIKYELLQIDQKNQNTKGRKGRIEDKLIEYGEALKIKRAQEKVDKIKTEDMQYSFKPETEHSQISYNKMKEKFGGNLGTMTDKDFFTRALYYEETKGNHLEYLKTKNIKQDDNEYTFKPKLQNFAKNIKRTIDDLYAWKTKTENARLEKQRQKAEEEAKEIKDNIKPSYVNKESNRILTMKKNQTTGNASNTNRIIENNEDEDDDDMNLWPAELNKLYA